MDKKSMNRGGYFRKLNGFAVSGVLYPILILTLFLIVQFLVTMSNRKEILDQSKEKLLESVNAANKVYSNEELSVLVDELKSEHQQLEKDTSYYEPKDLTNVYSPSELKVKVEKGDFSGLHIGDYFKVKLPDSSPFDSTCTNYQATNYLQIAGFDSYLHYGNVELTKHHIVFLFRNVIARCPYNDTNTNLGSYPASKLKLNVDKIVSIMCTKPGKETENWYSYILPHNRQMSALSTDGKTNVWKWFSDVKLFLLKETEAAGSSFFSSADANAMPLQLPLFSIYGTAMSIKFKDTPSYSGAGGSRAEWWLEVPMATTFSSHNATNSFIFFTAWGSIEPYQATALMGVAPAFLFG